MQVYLQLITIVTKMLKDADVHAFCQVLLVFGGCLNTGIGSSCWGLAGLAPTFLPQTPALQSQPDLSAARRGVSYDSWAQGCRPEVLNPIQLLS